MAHNSKQTAFFAEIHGRVQGVGFRYSALAEAKRLCLNGWVRNTFSGSVEVFAQGPWENTEKFLQWLHKGPPSARIDQVICTAREPDQNCTAFRIER